MFMWYIILFFLIVFTGLAFLYLARRMAHFSLITSLNKKGRKYHVNFGFLIIATGFAILWIFLNLMNAVVCLLYLMLFWFISDLIFGSIHLITKKPFCRYYAGYAAIMASCLVLGIGWYQNHHITVTTYTVATKKEIPPLKIAFFADSHIGTTFDAAGFKKHLQKIQSEQPDIVFIVGDFVDDNTSRADMLQSVRSLKDLQTRYGVYFVFGNHDKGYYGAAHRGFSAQNLLDELKKSHVTVLQDDILPLGNHFNIIGRQDSSETFRGKGRQSMQELMSALDKNQFSVVLDHQPNDYQNQQEANVDLVLSGHTHGGQLWPLNEVGVWIGANDKTYGYEKRGNTHFIVTSGLSDWSIKFKTGTKSEFVIVNIVPEH